MNGGPVLAVHAEDEEIMKIINNELNRVSSSTKEREFLKFLVVGLTPTWRTKGICGLVRY